MTTTLEKQLLLAECLGMTSFTAGRPFVPAQDPDLMKMLEGRTPGTTPEGEAATMLLFLAWTNGWKLAQSLAAPSAE